MAEYTHLISENVAPKEAKRIVVFDSSGNKTGRIGLYGLKQDRTSKKLYSFGALADVHVQYNTSREDFQRALAYLNETEDVAFTCIAGDLTNNGSASELQVYANYVKEYSPNTPVYECTGNHECETNAHTKDSMKPYTGHELYYSFAQGDDVFIMFGMTAWLTKTGDQTFSGESLQWLYETLEANRNKRCFVFQHVLRFDGSGKPYSPNMTGNLLNCTSGQVFCSLMEHYTNVVWFHGHSHMKFDCQTDCDYANYDNLHGCRSVHIPSLAIPRDYENDEYFSVYEESEGYVVDVYENHIVLRGRDFVKETFVPLATYRIDTDLTDITEKSYTDSTGTITI